MSPSKALPSKVFSSALSSRETPFVISTSRTQASMKLFAKVLVVGTLASFISARSIQERQTTTTVNIGTCTSGLAGDIITLIQDALVSEGVTVDSSCAGTCVPITSLLPANSLPAISQDVNVEVSLMALSILSGSRKNVDPFPLQLCSES
ncbi:hypothetical protein ACEPAG_3250 [Sanghuangporus baumii]